MVMIPDIRVSTATPQTQDVVPETNLVQLAGQALEGVEDVQRTLDQVQIVKDQRDADAWNIKSTSELRQKGLQHLEDARNEAETPDQITELLIGKLDSDRDELYQSAPNDLARNGFDKSFQQVKASFTEQAIRDQIAETQKMRMDSLDSAIGDKVNFIRSGGTLSDSLLAIEQDLENASSFIGLSEAREIKNQAFNEARKSHLDYLIETGDLETVTSLLNNEKFNKDLTTPQIDTYRNLISREVKKANEKRLVLDGLESGFFDPKDKASKDAIDLVFKESIAPAMLAGDGSAFTSAVNLTTASGVVPPTLEGYIRSAYIGNNQENKIIAYNYIDEVKTQNPSALEYSTLTDDQITEATMFSELLSDGVPENEAMSIIQNKFRSRTPEVVKVRKAELSKGGSAYMAVETGDISNIFDEFQYDANLFSDDYDVLSVPAKESAYMAKYKDLYEKYYIETGDVDIAKKRAKEVFKKKHGVSKVTNNDGYITDYPAEVYYKHPLFFDEFENEDKTYEWQREQLLQFAKDEIGKDVDYESLRIVPDYITELEVKRKIPPTYLVMIETEEEGLQPINRIQFNLQDALKKKRAEIKSTLDKPEIEKQRDEGVVDFFLNINNTSRF